MMRAFDQDIWIADGPVVTGGLGFRFPTRMAVIRLDEGLFIWSPVALSDDLRAAIDALGSVRFIVSPTVLHHVFLAEWRAAFPAARMFAPPGLRARRPDLTFDGDLGEAPEPVWSGTIDQAVMAGNAIATEIVFFHRISGTALFADLLQHMPPDWYAGWRRLVARIDLMTAAEPSVPRKFRLAFTGRRAARAALGRIRAWPVRNVIMAHGAPVEGGGAAVIASAFRWLSD